MTGFASNDLGRFTESEAMFDSDMKVYIGDGNTEYEQEIQDNVNLMKKWKAEGK